MAIFYYVKKSRWSTLLYHLDLFVADVSYTTTTTTLLQYHKLKIEKSSKNEKEKGGKDEKEGEGGT